MLNFVKENGENKELGIVIKSRVQIDNKSYVYVQGSTRQLGKDVRQML